MAERPNMFCHLEKRHVIYMIADKILKLSCRITCYLLIVHGIRIADWVTVVVGDSVVSTKLR